MFASRSFGRFGSGGNSLDVPVASLAGLAVAFLAFAAPAELLADLIGASGLPSILPAAEPPLGLKARLGLGAAGAVVIFVAAFLLLRWLDRVGKRRAEHAAVQADLDAPRLRRRDIHPDAPARPPLLAVHELGNPDELVLDQVNLARHAAWQVDPSPTPASQAEPQAEPVVFDTPPPPVDAPPRETRQPLMQEPDDQAAAYALSQRRWTDPEPPCSERPDDRWHDERASLPEPEWSAGDEPAISSEPEWDSGPAQADAEPAPQCPEPEAEWAPPAATQDWSEPADLPVEAEPEGEPQWETPAAVQPWADRAEVAGSRLPEPETESQWETPAPVHPWADRADVAGSRLPEPEAESQWEPPAAVQPWADAAGITRSDLPEPEAESQWEPPTAVQPWSEPVPLASHPDPEPESEPALPTAETFVAPITRQPELDAETDWEPRPTRAWPQPEAPAEPPLRPAEPAPAPATGSIAELMARLELGLARRGVGPAASAPPPPVAVASEPPAPPAPAPEPADDRLQNAIQSLQRFAARQD